MQGPRNAQSVPEAARDILWTVYRDEEKEVLWRIVDSRPEATILRARFGEEDVTVERLGLTIFNRQGKRLRVIVGDWIVAVDEIRRSPVVFSNGPNVQLTVRQVAGEPQGTVQFPDLALRFAKDGVSGWNLSHEDRRLARHGLPWKESHTAMQVEWVTYLTRVEFWPHLGIALGMLDFLRPYEVMSSSGLLDPDRS